MLFLWMSPLRREIRVSMLHRAQGAHSFIRNKRAFIVYPMKILKVFCSEATKTISRNSFPSHPKIKRPLFSEKKTSTNQYCDGTSYQIIRSSLFSERKIFSHSCPGTLPNQNSLAYSAPFQAKLGPAHPEPTGFLRGGVTHCTIPMSYYIWHFSGNPRFAWCKTVWQKEWGVGRFSVISGNLPTFPVQSDPCNLTWWNFWTRQSISSNLRVILWKAANRASWGYKEGFPTQPPPVNLITSMRLATLSEAAKL